MAKGRECPAHFALRASDFLMVGLGEVLPGKETVGMEVVKRVLELAAGNPVLILYVAYIVGLLITIAALKVSSSSQKS